MTDIFTKYYWTEGKISIYTHFRSSRAVRQIEISNDGTTTRLSEEYPIQGDAMLYDQSFEDLDISDSNFITEEEFENVWDDETS